MIEGYEVTDWLCTTAGASLVRARHATDHALFLIKQLPPNSSPTRVAELRHEYEILRSLNVPGVIKPITFLPGPTSPALVLEHFDGQVLKRLLNERRLDLPTCL